MNPSVSINLCCYNSEKYLRETLESIAAQTYTDWELVVINDGSTDSTESIVSEFRDRKYPVIYHYQENKGLGVSRNEALRLSRGDYIAFIDHDDIWMPEKLELQLNALNKDPIIPLVYTDGYFINDQGMHIEKFFDKMKPFRGQVFKKLLLETPIALSSVVVNKSVFNDIGYFNPSFSISEEYDLFLRLTLKYDIDYIEKPLVKYRLHEGNTMKKFDILYNEVLQIFTYWLGEKIDSDIKDTVKRALLKESLKCATHEVIKNKNVTRAFHRFTQALPVIDMSVPQLIYYISGFYISHLKSGSFFHIKKYFLQLRQKYAGLYC